MTPKVNWMYIELGVPLFILSIGLSLRASQWVNMITSNGWLQQLTFPLVLGLLVLVFELTKLSKMRVHALLGLVIILNGLWIEALIEPGDYL